MGHWYTKDGIPRHTQPDGKDTTLRHARLQELVPSVTEILGIMDKPGLNLYFINQHLGAAWDMPANDSYADKDYDWWCKEIRQKAAEHSNQARDKGIEVHNALERAFLGKEVPDEHLTTVDAVSRAIYDKYGSLESARVEQTFGTETYGGTVDLILPEDTNPGRVDLSIHEEICREGVILDYKRKADGWDKKKNGDPKKIWYVESHAAQLAAYRAGLGMHDCKCANVFISPDDEVYIHEWSEEDLAQGLSIFMASLNLWKTVKRFP